MKYYNTDREIEQLCFSIRQDLKASIDSHATFSRVVGTHNISLEFISTRDLVLQVKPAGQEHSVDEKLPLSQAINDYYDIEKSVATVIYRYQCA